ncbi:MAG: leucine-rich repeat domain-containing protein [Clostridia bacterium]|nr:leucine-rich repeat domain-containing protein [Clostridia bacterium]
MGESAFRFCDRLTEVVLPPRLTRIEEGTFTGCTSLTKITIPAGVTYIHDDAFQNCGKLTIYGYAGSAAETFAREHEIPFVAL